MTLERGALLNNRYKIEEILGQGGMGSVYRAVDENLGMEVALKDNFFTTEEFARQFRREAVILANLRHPNLPRVTDHFVIEGQGQYLVMDYIDGEDLRQRMDRLGLLSDEEAIIIGAAICDALTYLGSYNPPVVHRDIKPGNVKITPDGRIFLVDFGLAKMVEGSQVTTTGARAMTPGYSPPEQYGTARTDQRSDIYSLGATLYAALTGALPEDGLARAMEQETLTPVRRHNPQVSRRLAGVIEKSLSIRPDDRYQDAEKFKRALLRSSNTTRRKTGEYRVPPPPDGAVERGISPALKRVESGGGGPVDGFEFSPQAPSQSWPASRPGKRGRLHGCWMVALIAALLLAGGSGAAYLTQPVLSAQAVAWVMALPNRLPFLAADPTQTPDLPASTSTAGPGGKAAPEKTEENSPQPTQTVMPAIVQEPTASQTPTATLTPMPTATGGGTGELAFASDRSGTNQIYSLELEALKETQITNMPEGACQPSWSPDGKRIVFISPCEANRESYPGSGLFVINIDGSGLMPLPTVPGGDYDPSWSPDGKRIAFTSLRKTGRPRIYVFDLEENKASLLSNEFARDFQPSWSPDGKKITFVSTQKGSPQVWVMDADGKNQVPFFEGDDWIIRQPTYSPNGELVLFTMQVEYGSFPRLVLASLEDEGANESLLNPGPIPMREAKFSPDGLWLAVESWPKGNNHDIYVMSANGAGKYPVTTDPARDFDPAWNPAPAGNSEESSEST